MEEAAIASARDAGLAKRIGVAGLTANIVNYIVGAAAFVAPASAARMAGAWAPVAFLGAALGALAIGWCFAEGGSRVPTSGGPYGFVEAAFGRPAGFLTGVFVYVGNLVAAGAIAAAAADQGATLLPSLGGGPARWAAIVITFALFGLLNWRGVAVATRAVKAAAAIKMLPFLLMFVLALPLIHPGNLPAPAPPVPHEFGRALLLAVFLFMGIHGGLLVSGEVEAPARTIPRAAIAGIVIITVLFLGILFTAEGALGLGRLAGSKAPLADTVALAAPGWRWVMVLGALVSMTGWLISDSLGTPRQLFAFARDGRLPAWLGALDPVSRAPVRAVAVHCALAAALALGGSFERLAILSTLVLIAVMILGCLAAARLRKQGASLAGRPVRLPGLYFACTVAIAQMAWAAAQATTAEIGGLALLTALALIWFALTGRSAPAPRPV